MTTTIDHLVFTSPSLVMGMDHVERLLGYRPVPGGRHPVFGTCNAILSLGNSTYLEVLAPDPQLPSPSKGRWMNEAFSQAPKISTWALQTSEIQELRHRANLKGPLLGEVICGSREQLEGTMLQWQLTDPYSLPFNGAVPFLIDWGTSDHPATYAPKAGKLINLRIEHPTPNLVTEVLKTLGVNIPITKAHEFTLTASIRTPSGQIIEIT